jgi:integrase
MASIYKSSDGKRWRVIVRRKGSKPVSKYFSSHLEAQKWAREQEVEADRGQNTAPGLRLTVGALVRTYKENLSKTYGTTKEWNLQLLEKQLGHVRLEEVSGPSIVSFIQRREREGAGPSTNGQTLSYLRTVIRHGGALAGAGQAVAVALANMDLVWDTLMHTGRISHSQKRNRRPTEAELSALFDYFDSRPKSNVPMTELVMFAIATTMRLGEIVGAKGVVWEDFNPDHRSIWIRKRKDPTVPGGRDMLVPLPNNITTLHHKTLDPVAIMLRQKTARLQSGRVFPYAKNTVTIAFSHACSELGIEDLVFHDLRHEAISRLFEAGWTIAQVAALSGHKSWKNLQRYTHISAESFVMNK